ncbi:MAG: hypothetical protein ACKOCX_11135 [Planctomycetota bacterium]
MSIKPLLSAAATTAAILAAFVAGSFFGRSQPLPRALAMSSISEGDFAACTAALDMNTEGIFLLDFETGDLNGGVLNPNTGKFTTTYRYNVLDDLGFKFGEVKEPRFLIVPGRASFSGNVGGRMAQSALYVTDASTGVTVAYGIPWSPQQANAAKPVTAELVPLDVARPRGGAAGAP